MAADQSDNTPVRLAVVGIVCISLFAALFVRLYYLQVIDHETYEVESAAVHIRTKHEQGPRGRILDRNGNILVDNKIVVVVGIDKEVSRTEGLGDGAVLKDGSSGDSKEEQAKRNNVFKSLAILLTKYGIPTKVTTLERLYTDVRYTPNDFLPIADEGITEELKAYLGEHRTEFPGVLAKARTQRVYPYGNLAAHLLGYVGQIIPEELARSEVKAEGTTKEPAGPDAKPYANDDQIGKSGVEREFEKYLRGKPGDTVIQVDARGQRIGTVKSPELAQGDDVWLTIDINFQAATENQLAAQIAARGTDEKCSDVRCNALEGSAVIIDPRNGEVLAMASYPTFDPGLLVDGISTDLWEFLTSNETHKPMLNRALAESYEPGSTFKLVTTHAALTSKLVTPEEVYQDRGVYRLDDCTGGKCDFTNAGSVALGAVDLQQAITKSSDTYYYRLADLFWRGRKLFGETPIQDSARLFGFGFKTGIALPTESSGLIGDPEWLRKSYDSNPDAWDRREWTVGDNINAAIGQGFVNVTPLQLANAYATFANGGTRYVPQIVKKVTRPKSLAEEVTRITNVEEIVVEFPAVKSAEVMFANDDQYWVVYRGLQGVTTSGTAAKEFRQNPTSWPMAGKTGTAQVTGKADSSVFVGFGPATGVEPALYAMAAIIPEAGFGSDAAAPLVFKVMQQISDNRIPAIVPRSIEKEQAGPVATVPTTTAPPEPLVLAPDTNGKTTATTASTSPGATSTTSPPFGSPEWTP